MRPLPVGWILDTCSLGQVSLLTEQSEQLCILTICDVSYASKISKIVIIVPGVRKVK